MSELASVSDVSGMSKEDLIGLLGGIYEHSSWVAERLYDTKKKDEWKTVGDVYRAMKEIVDESSMDEKLELLKAHPDLCEKIERLKTLTKASQEEQGRAGLDTLTEQERTTFQTYNTNYRTKFGFPFILAVRNATKYTVLSAIQGRIDASYDTEFAGALYQVHKIAWMRLLTTFQIQNPKGFLTCHVLDTAHGCPGTSSLSLKICHTHTKKKQSIITQYDMFLLLLILFWVVYYLCISLFFLG